MEEKERYECKYNEKLMKHYTFDNENKEELGYKGVVRVLNQQNARIKELEEENQQLKQQLAEKDKEIEYYKKQVKKFNNEAQKYFEDAYCNDFHNQDKISFAVEQLEKVLKTLEEKQFYKKEDTAYCVHPAQIAEYIDNQIEELKKEIK